jgi:hypothetical protein
MEKPSTRNAEPKHQMVHHKACALPEPLIPVKVKSEPKSDTFGKTVEFTVGAHMLKACGHKADIILLLIKPQSYNLPATLQTKTGTPALEAPHHYPDN